MKYTVVVGHSHWHLIDLIEECLKQGWQLLGGVSVGNQLFYQAMTKEEKPLAKTPASGFWNIAE